jgi:hypothetical protein
MDYFYTDENADPVLPIHQGDVYVDLNDDEHEPSPDEEAFIREAHETAGQGEAVTAASFYYHMIPFTVGTMSVWWMPAEHPVACVILQEPLDAVLPHEHRADLRMYEDELVKDGVDFLLSLCQKYKLPVDEKNGE